MLETTWSALAEPSRRAVLDLLVRRPRTVTEIVAALGLAQPTVSKHLKVLREAGLVRVSADAQRRIYAMEPEPLAALDEWLTPYRALWNARPDDLGRQLDAHPEPAAADQAPEPARAAPSPPGPARDPAPEPPTP